MANDEIPSEPKPETALESGPLSEPMPESGPDPETQTGPARRAWQGQRPIGDDDAGSAWRRTRLFIVVGILSLLVTLIVVLVLFIAPPTPAPSFLTINVAEHNDKHFPHQAFARADSEILMQHFEVGKKKEATTRSKELLLNELNGLKDRTTDALVIHLTATALVRGETVYLLPADAEADNEATWLNIEQVLQAVEKCPAKHKLLILDVAHGLIDPRLGVHADRVAEVLDDYLRKDEPSYLVLTPCSSGQTSQTSEVLRSSVFAFYLNQGLQGDADIERKETISVLELVKYLQPRVDRWARHNRGVRQEPRLYGKGEDFTIAPLGRPAVEKKTPVALEPYPDALVAAWKKHDDVLNRGAFHVAPRRFLQLEANLLRDERRWSDGTTGKNPLDQNTRNLIDELSKLVSATVPTPRLLSVNGIKENLNATKAVLNVFRRFTDAKKAQEEIAAILMADKNADDPQRIRTIIEALSQLPELQQGHLKLAHAMLGGLKAKEQFVEAVYVERLAAFADREFSETFQQAKIEVLWRTMREHEAALAASAEEPEFLPWVISTIVSADKVRRAAEGKILWERPPVWPEAIRDLKSCGASYGKAKKTLEGMQTANVALNRALADLPAFLPVLGDVPDADPYAEEVWFKAAEEATYLQRFFAALADENSLAGAKLESRGRDLQQNLDELAKTFQVRLKSIENFETPTAQRQLRRLLRSPRLPAAERADLIKKLRASSAKLHDATESSDQPAPKLGTHDARLVRAEMSFALLRLAGLEPTGPDFVLPARKEPRGIVQREKKLQESWGIEGLAKRYREAAPGRQRHLLSCLVSPWDPAGKDGDDNRQWQVRLRDDYTQWLKTQYEQEGREGGPRMQKTDDPRDQAIREFYRDASQ